MTQGIDTVLDDIDREYGSGTYVMEGHHPTILRLNDKKIKSFKKEWLLFTKLQELSLNHNKIDSIPSDIHRLKLLDELVLSNNKLKKLPINLTKLRKLSKLFLNNNRLASLPDKLGDLIRLEIFELGNNLLKEIPHSIGNLKYLTVLHLGRNNLTAIPAEIGYLANLEVLDLTNNDLTSLPASLGSLRKLNTLSLGGNPLAEPLTTLAQRGRDAVLSYLRSMSNSIPLYEARVLLVGEGNVGKSTLVDAMMGKSFQEHRDPTHGIQVGALKLPNPDAGSPDKQLTLNTWDFGGQDLYRITHQFFYSKRSVYLLVWKPREGVEQNSVEGWLERLRLRLANREAKVLVVATHSEECRAEIDRPGLRNKFGDMIGGFFEIDSRTGSGIDRLKLALAATAAQLPQMGSLLNPSWVKARDAICGLPDTHITKKRLGEICQKHGMDKVAAATLADLLHDLGRLIHYSEYDGLQELVVLKPEWLTRAISFVLVDRVTAEAKGVLDHRRLQTIWNNPSRAAEDRYPAKLHPYFLRLMEEFDISFRDEASPQSIISQMVPYERPDIPAFAPGPKLVLIYELQNDAPGLVPWLIVRTHRFTAGVHWRRGVFLQYQSHTALIELDSSDRFLRLTVHGQSPPYFFHLLIDIINQIMDRWPGLHYERLIPCRTTSCAMMGTPGYFKLSTLERARAAQRMHYPCEQCLIDVDVNELLTGFATGPKKPILDDILALTTSIANDTRQMANDTRLNEVLAITRMLWKGFNSELLNGPGLFTLWPDDEHTWWERLRLKNLTDEKYDLRLWCSHPECPHPVRRYVVTQSREWLRTVAPYVNLGVKVLQLGIPVFGAGIAAMIPEDYSKIKPKIDAMDKFASSLKDELGLTDLGNVQDSGLTEAQGAGLRAFQSLLHKTDPDSDWGGLRRVLNTAGDILWVCPNHYVNYDPGLPILPYSDADSTK